MRDALQDRYSIWLRSAYVSMPFGNVKSELDARGAR